MENVAFFPHEKVRRIQEDLIADVQSVLNHRQSLIAHAPTGLGKTAATLSPALEYALNNKLTVFFLTSRNTQHHIAVETLKQIKTKYDLAFKAVDIIGKKWMCSVPNVDMLSSSEFAEFCKLQREENKCSFYTSTKKSNKLTPRAQKNLAELFQLSPVHIEELLNICKKDKLCPFEMACSLAEDSSVVIGDYYHIFNSNIRESLFNKAKKELQNSILIVDEAHNLPSRLCNLMTHSLSNLTIRNAVKELKKYGYEDTIPILSQLQDTINDFSADLQMYGEKLIKKQDFIEKISKIDNYESVVAELGQVGDKIKELRKRSFCSSIASFLDAWQGDDLGFVRVLSRKLYLSQPLISLQYKCLDPSLLSKEIFQQVHSSVLMSGTLTPTFMYKDLLGIENGIEKIYPSPFPKKNRLNLIIPKTSTKFTARSELQYKRIAVVCSQITNNVPGNSAVFFPSYSFKKSVSRYFSQICEKTIFEESPKFSKNEKAELLENFKNYNNATLLAVVAANFAEGIDIPKNILKCVIIVGLPLQPPSLEVKELISYYDKKFGRGWDYGYTMPAITKTLQAAGRCIRSEKDKGVIIFLDERFIWKNYFKCFPQDIDFKVSEDFLGDINDFFDKHE